MYGVNKHAVPDRYFATESTLPLFLRWNRSITNPIDTRASIHTRSYAMQKYFLSSAYKCCRWHAMGSYFPVRVYVSATVSPPPSVSHCVHFKRFLFLLAKKKLCHGTYCTQEVMSERWKKKRDKRWRNRIHFQNIHLSIVWELKC